MRVIFFLSLIAFSQMSFSVQVERDAEIFRDYVGEQELINSVVGVIKHYGYRCDTLSSLYPISVRRPVGFRVACNRWSFIYEVRDEGNNRWIVKRKQ